MNGIVDVNYPEKEDNPVEYTLPQDLAAKLKEGSVLWKVRSYQKWYRRKYTLNLEKMQVAYDWSRKVPCLSQPVFHIDISEIHDVRKGWQTDTFNKFGSRIKKRVGKHPQKSPRVEEKCCFSIVHGPHRRTLDLVAPDEDTCDAWICGLQQIVATEKSIAYKRGYELWLIKQFKMADKDKTGTLNFDECIELMVQLNINVSVQHAKTLFKKANVNRNVRGEEEVLDENEFLEFYRSLLNRPELSEIMRSFGIQHAEIMGPEELCSFSVREQKMQNVTLDGCKALIKAYESENTDNIETSVLTLGGFRLFLLSEQQDIFNHEHRSVYQDMTRPLCDYYVASSHNTYLMGSQLIGDSSVEAYINALNRGCRCIELDLWDGDEGEPIIFHGYTLTTKIQLREVLQDALKPYAFKATDYPLILSLENHCSLLQQQVASHLFQTILGDELYTCPTANEFTELPSPERLKRKFILKAKKYPEIQEEDDFDGVRYSGHSGSDDTEDEVDVDPPSDDKLGLYPKIVSKQISHDLSDLVALRSVKFESFDVHRNKGRCFDMISLSEKKAQHFISECVQEMVDHTQRNLIRIYPGGGRTNSSNLKPIPMWNGGCQIVSLNYQTEDKPNLFNTAKFRQNGNCGYALKPDFLCKGDFKESSLIASIFSKILTIRVISGQHIPKPKQSAEGEVVDPYVIIKVRGHIEDKRTAQTGNIHNNGFNPIWNETFTFPVRFPELAFVHFVVRDQCVLGKDELLGEYVLPFTSVEQGYRHVHLVDSRGNSMVPASLFVHVTISDN